LGTVRVGALGGTFNPIHHGHLQIARKIQTLFSLSQVHFVVATMPPHKRPEDLIPFVHRYAMVSLALSDIPDFVPSPIELEPEASSYSIDTMRKLGRSIGQDKLRLFFIAGGDSLLEVKSWRESDTLLTLYDFVFVIRPGIRRIVPGDVLPAGAAARVRDLTGLKPVQVRRRIGEESGDGKRIYIVDAGAPDISATRIRDLVSSGKSIRRMVPGPVREYIHKLRLYGER